MKPPLALRPHHDGSALYIANQQPQLMERVKMRLRVHSSLGKVSRVLVRQSDSGEAFMTAPAKVLMHRHGWDWYETSVVMYNPELHYRWFIELADGTSYWLNATGLHRLDQPDRDDFKLNTYRRPPAWATGAVLYQVFPDRFARSKQASKHQTPDWAIAKGWADEVTGSGPGTSEQFFGGDLPGITEHLDHLKRLGATILYLTPFFPARSNHRYDASSFDAVDPLLGGDKALTELVKQAHAQGLKVMGDLTANHSGDAHEWFRAAFENPKAPESDFYYFGEGNRSYDSWWGVASLPKLNWNSQELRRRFLTAPDSVLKRWLKAPFKLDGWRIDVANMTGRIRQDDMNREVAKLIRESMDEVSEDTFLIGEFTSDAAHHVQGDGYQSTMTYANFTRPLWRWLWRPGEKREEGQLGVGQRHISARDVIELHTKFAGVFPWQLRMHNLNALDTHDTGRFKTFTIPGAQRVAAGLQFTMPGIPMIFAGDEFGLDGWNGESSRTPIPWDGERTHDPAMIEVYATLANLRRKHKSLVHGSLRWLYASEEALVFARETKTETTLVLASRGKDRHVEFSAEAVPGAELAENIFGGGRLRKVGSKVRFDGGPLDFQIWRLPSAVR